MEKGIIDRSGWMLAPSSRFQAVTKRLVPRVPEAPPFTEKASGHGVAAGLTVTSPLGGVDDFGHAVHPAVEIRVVRMRTDLGHHVRHGLAGHADGKFVLGAAPGQLRQQDVGRPVGRQAVLREFRAGRLRLDASVPVGEQARVAGRARIAGRIVFW